MNYKNIISKDDFVRIIESLKKTGDFNDRLNNVLEEYCDGYIFLRNSVNDTIIVLEKMFMCDDFECISYFCYDLDFGREWKPGTITYQDGTDIKMQTAEDLYEYLIRYMEGNA